MDRVRRCSISLIAGILLTASGCRGAKDISATSDALRQILAGKPVLPVRTAVWADAREFYKRRDDKAAWAHRRGAGRSREALEIVRAGWRHGLAGSDYGEERLAELVDGLDRLDTGSIDGARQLAELDVAVTTALLALGRDVALGRTSPARLDPRWKTRRRAPDFVSTLDRAAAGPPGDAGRWLESLEPRDPQYGALTASLANLRGQLEKGGWPRVDARALKPGTSSPAVVVLRQRLEAGGFLAQVNRTSPLYDSGVMAGVRAFQDLHALKATGIADSATIAAMNVPIEERIRQIGLNLERWRWMPDDLGARHLLVNIPYYHLIAREHGQSVKEIRVVVGRADSEHETPVFSSTMTTVVFSPYWNIPDTIAEGETVPAVARDPGYLTRNNIEILRRSGSRENRVDPATIDWDDPDAIRQLAFRQRPGSRNALGHVKFLFPSAYDVYIHDTPEDSLFVRRGRALSHGCIRVEEPDALARYVLREMPDWDDVRIAGAMKAGVETPVKLHESIPVHIVYFTTWVDDHRGLHFLPDVYGFDEKQAVLKSARGSRRANHVDQSPQDPRKAP